MKVLASKITEKMRASRSSSSENSAVLSTLQFKKSTWIFIGVFIWVWVVVSHIPAHWAAYAITRAAPVAMSGVTGTLWSGKASLASVRINQTDLSLGQLSWSLEILPLFQLKTCAHITTSMDNQTFDGRVCAQKNKFVIENATASLPARAVQPFTPISLDGQFSFNIDNWQMAENKLQKLRAKIAWINARVYNGSNWMAFGVLAADLVDDTKNGLSAHVFDVNSPLRIDAVINLLYPLGGSVKGGMGAPEGFVKDANATAWLSMFATQQGQAENGQLKYTFDVNF